MADKKGPPLKGTQEHKNPLFPPDVENTFHFTRDHINGVFDLQGVALEEFMIDEGRIIMTEMPDIQGHPDSMGSLTFAEADHLSETNPSERTVAMTTLTFSFIIPSLEPPVTRQDEDNTPSSKDDILKSIELSELLSESFVIRHTEESPKIGILVSSLNRDYNQPYLGTMSSYQEIFDCKDKDYDLRPVTTIVCTLNLERLIPMLPPPSDEE